MYIIWIDGPRGALRIIRYLVYQCFSEHFGRGDVCVSVAQLVAVTASAVLVMGLSFIHSFTLLLSGYIYI